MVFFFNYLAIIVRKTCVDKISLSIWPSVFILRETRNLSGAFIRMSDSYHGNGLGHWRQIGEQSASTSTAPSIRIIEASKSSASFNQKIGRKKWKRRTVPTSNHDSAGRRELGDFDFVFVVFFIFPLFIIILCIPFFLLFLSSYILGSLWYFSNTVLVFNIIRMVKLMSKCRKSC